MADVTLLASGRASSFRTFVGGFQEAGPFFVLLQTDADVPFPPGSIGEGTTHRETRLWHVVIDMRGRFVSAEAYDTNWCVVDDAPGELRALVTVKALASLEHEFKEVR